MTEDRAKYEDNLDKVIEGNNNIYSRLNVLEQKITAMISLYRDEVINNSKLELRILKLEQSSDYPNEEELGKIKIGLND